MQRGVRGCCCASRSRKGETGDATGRDDGLGLWARGACWVVVMEVVAVVVAVVVLVLVVVL